MLEHVSTAFRVAGTEDAELHLAAVVDGCSSPNLEQYTARFHGHAALPWVQGGYRLEHEALGTLDVFLVPTGREGDAVVLDAAVARFIDAAQGGQAT